MKLEGPIRVLLVEDSPEVRSLLERFVARTPDMTVVAAVPCNDEVEAAVTVLHPDVVAIDILPGSPGPCDAIQAVLERNPSASVLVLSSRDDQRSIDAALDAGAMGFVSKFCSPLQILAAIREVHAGRICVARDQN